MKKNKFLMLCTLLMVGAFTLTACGGTNNNGGTEAPYEDETNKKVNDNYNNDNYNNGGTNNNGYNNGSTGSDLEDAGRNLMDSIKDTGDAIRDGVDNLGNGNSNNGNTTTNP